MKFVKGLMVGSLITTGVIMAWTDNDMTTKKITKKGKERLEKLSKKNRLFKIREKKQEPAPEPETKICPFCFSEINYKAVKCPHCTSDLK